MEIAYRTSRMNLPACMPSRLIGCVGAILAINSKPTCKMHYCTLFRKQGLMRCCRLVSSIASTYDPHNAVAERTSHAANKILRAKVFDGCFSGSPNRQHEKKHNRQKHGNHSFGKSMFHYSTLLLMSSGIRSAYQFAFSHHSFLFYGFIVN